MSKLCVFNPHDGAAVFRELIRPLHQFIQIWLNAKLFFSVFISVDDVICRSRMPVFSGPANPFEGFCAALLYAVSLRIADGQIPLRLRVVRGAASLIRSIASFIFWCLLVFYK